MLTGRWPTRLGLTTYLNEIRYPVARYIEPDQPAGLPLDEALRKNELPSKPLRAVLPVSLRSAEQAKTGGNSIAVMPIDLHTTIEEPLWREAWNLKVFGYVNTCHAAYESMKARGKGVIVNVIGAAGERAGAHGAGELSQESLRQLEELGYTD